MIADCVRRGADDGRIYYYNEGAEFASITGGWVTGYSNGTGSQSKETNHLYMQVSSGVNWQRTYITDIKVDVTNISKLYVDWDGIDSSTLGNHFMRLYTGKNNTDSFNGAVSRQGSFSRMTEFIDVSAITGTYHISLFAFSGSSSSSVLRVYKVYGEV